jgi:molybdenum cofactor biosynthesis enzyme MoaA
MLPGGCNAHCAFCCWSRREEPFDKPAYISKLEPILINLLSKANSINILGGEPLISPHLENVLNLIKKLKEKYRFPKIVITTNGSALPNKLDSFKGVINHVNLSRHGINDEENKELFGNKAFLAADRILEVANKLADYDIDLSINCVLHEKTPINTKQEVIKFIKFCKKVGAVSVCFKKVEGDSLDKVPQQLLFNSIPTIKSTTCDVCRTDLQLIENMAVYWQAALNRPSQLPRDVIIQPNLNVTSDWPGKVEYIF